MQQISLSEWMKVQKYLVMIESHTECPPGASFSMAGETHTEYTDGNKTYKSISGNGFCSYYVSED